MDLKNIGMEELLLRTRELARKERECTTAILWHLLEIDARKLFAELGYSSLFAYCKAELGYEEAAACRRISAMRLLRDVPEVETKLQNGSLTLTAASQVQRVIRCVRREKGKIFSKEEKLELLAKIENKSTRDCQKILCEIAPQAIREDRIRVIDATRTEIRFIADQELMRLLQRVKELGAYKLKGASDYTSLLKLMAKTTIEKLEPKPPGLKKVPAPKILETKAVAPIVSAPKGGANSPSAPTVMADLSQHTPPGLKAKFCPTRYIPTQARREVWHRDKGRCTYFDPKTKRRCEGRYGLQYDHVIPWALGGESTAENLRLLCPAHNALHAIRLFGEKAQITV